MSYDDLLIIADDNNLITKEKPLYAHHGRIKGNRIAIKQDLTTVEKACTLAEELGHHFTSTGNILDQNVCNNRKQEHRARIWSYNCMIGLIGLIKAFENHCQNRYEIAEYLNVTEEFLELAINEYRNKYGISTMIDNYIIYFIPNLVVSKII